MRDYACLRSVILMIPMLHTAMCAQPVTYEAFVAIGHGHLFRVEDNPLGSGPNLGAGVGLRHRSGLGVDFELNRTLGLSAKPVPCGIVNIPCEGSASQGVTGATILSANVRYEFVRARVRPYVTGGVGALLSKGSSVTVFASEQRAVFSEEKWSDAGLAINFGGGLHIQVSKGLSLGPELRLYNATALSRANLSLLRPALVIAWSW